MDVNEFRPAERQTRLRWGLGVLGAMMLMVVFVGARICTETGSYEQALSKGFQGLAEATRTQDLETYDAAIRQFRSASTLGVIDHFPVFALGTAESMRAVAAEEQGEPPATTPFHRALVRRDFVAARSIAAAEPKEALGAYMSRFITSLETH